MPRPSLAGAALRTLDDAEFYREVAERAGVPVLAGVFAAVLADPDDTLDRLHPHAAGQREVVCRMLPTLHGFGLLARCRPGLALRAAIQTPIAVCLICVNGASPVRRYA